jgi:hypothetical protein
VHNDVGQDIVGLSSAAPDNTFKLFSNLAIVINRCAMPPIAGVDRGIATVYAERKQSYSYPKLESTPARCGVASRYRQHGVNFTRWPRRSELVRIALVETEG